MYPSKFLIFVANELFGAKLKEFKTNIYNEKSLHILEIYVFKKV